MKTFRLGGVHPRDKKLTSEVPIEVAELPQVAVFPLSQHIGAPAKAVVNCGDRVKVGTLIAEAGGFVSAPIYSSVSGVVASIDNEIDASGYRKPSIVINVQGDEWEDGIIRSDDSNNWKEFTSEEIIGKIRNAGIVGMGGACFPTHVKLTPPAGCKADCIIINGVECEPYLTADHRLMLEKTKDIITGIEILMKAAQVEKAYIGIECNKSDAIDQFRKYVEGKGITVVPLKMKYPQGGEKQLIEAITGREVPPPPAIPINVGVIVQNVGTAYAVFEAIVKNKPLIERVVTVTGNILAHPTNFLVRMGTPIGQLIQHCQPTEDIYKIISGGPMMGKSLNSDDAPVCKGTSGVIVLGEKEASRHEVQPCIRCAKCVAACPMGLEPYLIATSSALHEWEIAEKNAITSCIECGSCQFSCPSHRPMLDMIRLGKSTVMSIIKKRNAK